MPKHDYMNTTIDIDLEFSSQPKSGTLNFTELGLPKNKVSISSDNNKLVATKLSINEYLTIANYLNSNSGWLAKSTIIFKLPLGEFSEDTPRKNILELEDPKFKKSEDEIILPNLNKELYQPWYVKISDRHNPRVEIDIHNKFLQVREHFCQYELILPWAPAVELERAKTYIRGSLSMQNCVRRIRSSRA